MITNLIAPGDTTTPAKQPCDVCAAEQRPHRVMTGPPALVEPIEEAEFYDQSSQLHVHSGVQRIHQYRCSNGHEWAERFIYECPSCGWTVDNQGDATP